MASQYLTDDEITTYCDLLPVTQSQVIFASAIVDSFVGLDGGESKFKAHEATEKGLRPNRKGLIKLKHSPVLSLTKVALRVPNALSFTSVVEYPVEDFYCDEDGYIELPTISHLPITPNNLYGKPPVAMDISYTYGYKEIPEQVKLATAMIAMNISQQGGFANINSATNLDVRYSLTDPSVFTEDIRRMLVAYR